MFESIFERDDADYTRGALAEFATEGALVDAARALLERGYAKLDALTPRPIEALQQLITPARSNLPAFVFVAGTIGALTGFGVQWYCNAYDFPINVGGRPPFSVPAFIPITFEIMVLCAAAAAFFGGLMKMRLPRLAAPVFEAPGIERASIDRFWLLVSADDPRFDPGPTRAALLELGAEQVAIVPDTTPHLPPPADEIDRAEVTP
jgi:hypothetical protein